MIRIVMAAIATAAALAGGASAAERSISGVSAQIGICHGYGCAFRTRLTLDGRDAARLRAILLAGASSARAERAAITRAVQYFERRAMQATGVRDKPRAELGAARIKGQMDCIDEATNTRALLVYLAKRGLLKHHTVKANTSRGFLIDGRYPHWTAVIRDRAGADWVVDSWYAPMGGAPDIFLLSAWKERGVLESGALN